MSENRLIPQIRRESILLLLSLVYAFSLSVIVGEILHFPLSPLLIFVNCLLALLLFTLLFFNLFTILGALGVILIVFGLFYFFPPLQKAGWINDLLDQTALHIQNIGTLASRFGKEGFEIFGEKLEPGMQESFLFFAKFACVVLSLLTFLMIQKIRSYWLPSILMVILIPVTVNTADPWVNVFLIPMAVACFAMILLSSGHLLELLRKKKGFRHLLAAGSQLALVILLASLIAFLSVAKLNYNKLYSPFWQGIVDDLLTVLPEGLQPKLTISPFSLGDDGLYPLGNRLGGPIELKDQPVALVSGKIPTLLKVQSSDYYDGIRWQRLLNNPNYRYSSPFNGGAEMQVFNDKASEAFLRKLPEASADKLYEHFDYKLKPLKNGSQILFISGVPTRLRSDRSEAQLFYFNQAGTVFAKTVFDNKHAYEAESLDIDSQLLGFRPYAGPAFLKPEAVDRAYAESKDLSPEMANRKTAYAHYLQLPDIGAYKDGGSVKALADNLTSGLQGNASKTKAILDYLALNPAFKYDTKVPEPPENVDFVSYFLEQKVGYCSYYASAMTMLCRSAGIPARYIEGYALDADAETLLNIEGEIELNSKFAHAWTEVYIDGLGWLAVDPTPGGVSGSALPDKEEPEPTPSPSPTPTPTPTPTPETEPSEPEETTAPQQTTKPPAPDQNDEQKKDYSALIKLLLSLLLVLLILALIALLIYLYIKRRKDHIKMLHEPEALAERIPDTSERADFYWSQLTELHRICGASPKAAGLSEQNLARLMAAEEDAWIAEASKEGKNITGSGRPSDETASEETLLQLSLDDWNALAELITEVRYSRHRIEEDGLERFIRAFDLKEEQAKNLLSGRDYLFKRVLRPASSRLPKKK